PLCLTCHGTEIDPDIQKQIREIYTDDKATGFSTGMIRGAFTLQKDISTK
ncbi:MAG: DUF3365 domain-containing protein, partial [Anaerolineae bacterium]|nr:DUF3365 domain-containing protein [Anaerolineae bacterium]